LLLHEDRRHHGTSSSHTEEVPLKATELLKKQHREVKALFGKAKKVDPSGRRTVLDEITQKLRAHMTIEEDIFYPAVREIGTKKTQEIIPEAYEEHHVVALVLDELPDVDVEDERFEAKVTVLDELIEHHVEEEEGEMFKIAEKLGADRLSTLADEMTSAANGNGESDAPTARKAKR
jgi:hemerythrin-like domain-containing protein